jgi:hypothetical protein
LQKLAPPFQYNESKGGHTSKEINMKLRFKATGEESHCENAQARAFIAAGLAEEVKPVAQQADLTPDWSVIEYPGENRTFLAIQLKILGRTEYYSGEPDRAHDRINRVTGERFCSSFGRAIPQEVLERYRSQYAASTSLRDHFSKRSKPEPNTANVEMAAELRSRDDEEATKWPKLRAALAGDVLNSI